MVAGIAQRFHSRINIHGVCQHNGLFAIRQLVTTVTDSPPDWRPRHVFWSQKMGVADFPGTLGPDVTGAAHYHLWPKLHAASGAVVLCRRAFFDTRRISWSNAFGDGQGWHLVLLLASFHRNGASRK